MKAFAQVKSFARMESACVFSFGLLFLIHSRLHSRETLYLSECFHAFMLIYFFSLSTL